MMYSPCAMPFKSMAMIAVALPRDPSLEILHPWCKEHSTRDWKCCIRSCKRHATQKRTLEILLPGRQTKSESNITISKILDRGWKRKALQILSFPSLSWTQAVTDANKIPYYIGNFLAEQKCANFPKLPETWGNSRYRECYRLVAYSE